MSIAQILEKYEQEDPITFFEDPYHYFENTSEIADITLAFLEATKIPDGVSHLQKRGIPQALMDGIRKCLRLIVQAFHKIINWFQKIFKGKKSAKGVDQILNDLGIKRNSKPGKLPAVIPFSKRSNSKSVPTGIQVIMKPMELELSRDADTIQITPAMVNRAFITSHTGPATNRGRTYKYEYESIMALMHFIEKPELMEDLQKTAEDLHKGTVTPNTILRINRLRGESTGKRDQKMSHKIPMKKFQEFNIHLMKIHDQMKDIDDTRVSVGTNGAQTIKSLDLFNAILANLQIGASAVSITMRHIYVIDAAYCEMIDNIDALSEFIYAMMEAGVPDKYVAFNAWMVSSPKLKGNANIDKPDWNWTKVMFHPTNSNVLYKIALNGLGMRENKMETQISNTVYSAGLGESFAKVVHAGPHYTVIAMEANAPDKLKALGKLSDLKMHANVALHKAGIPGKLSNLDSSSIGFRGKDPVLIDYGNLSRKPIEEKKDKKEK